jgi:HemY protein
VDETPRERAQRLQNLVALNPEHRESRILDVEQALLAGDRTAARAAAERLDLAEPTARLCALMARTAMAAGDEDEARAWIARASGASHEPDWSDLDPEGEAFNYTREDWARVVASYAETGVLVHPRHERHEPVVSELPELPMSYSPSLPFARADLPAAPQPDDPGPYGDMLQPQPAQAPSPPGREGRWGRR